MSIWDKLRDKAATGAKASPTAAWWLLTKSPKLLRRGVQSLALYVASIAAEKALDELHQLTPDNKLIAKADTLARSVVSAENFLLGGAASLVKSGYETIPSASVVVQEGGPKKATHTAEAQMSEPLVNDQDAALPKREAAFMPVTSSPPRSRANMNAELAPDGLPEKGGYETNTDITWGQYMKPITPKRSDQINLKP